MRNILKIGRLSKKLLLGLMTALLLTIPALASEPIETEKTGSLTIENFYGEQAIFGTSFSVYRVAEVSENGWFTLLPAYENSGADVNNLTKAKDGRVAAEKLTAWVQTQKLPPDACQSTDQKGTASVSGLKTGLYLVIGEKTQIKDRVYTCSPSLVPIPEENPETGSWDYAVTIEPKNTVGSSTSDNPNNPNNPGTPDNPNNNSNKQPIPTDSSSNQPGSKPNKNLPDTGILQWPIPTLAGIGVGCMLLGWWLRRKKG